MDIKFVLLIFLLFTFFAFASATKAYNLSDFISDIQGIFSANVTEIRGDPLGFIIGSIFSPNPSSPLAIGMPPLTTRYTTTSSRYTTSRYTTTSSRYTTSRYTTTSSSRSSTTSAPTTTTSTTPTTTPPTGACNSACIGQGYASGTCSVWCTTPEIAQYDCSGLWNHCCCNPKTGTTTTSSITTTRSTSTLTTTTAFTGTDCISNGGNCRQGPCYNNEQIVSLSCSYPLTCCMPVTSCQNKCTPLAKECTSSISYRRCINWQSGSGGCYDWADYSCPSGQTCSGGQCSPGSTSGCVASNGFCRDVTGTTSQSVCTDADSLIDYSCGSDGKYCVSKYVSCASQCGSAGGRCSGHSCMCVTTTSTTTTSTTTTGTTTTTCQPPYGMKGGQCLPSCGSVPNSGPNSCQNVPCIQGVNVNTWDCWYCCVGDTTGNFCIQDGSCNPPQKCINFSCQLPSSTSSSSSTTTSQTTTTIFNSGNCPDVYYGETCPSTCTSTCNCLCGTTSPINPGDVCCSGSSSSSPTSTPTSTSASSTPTTTSSTQPSTTSTSTTTSTTPSCQLTTDKTSYNAGDTITATVSGSSCDAGNLDIQSGPVVLSQINCNNPSGNSCRTQYTIKNTDPSGTWHTYYSKGGSVLYDTTFSVSSGNNLGGCQITTDKSTYKVGDTITSSVSGSSTCQSKPGGSYIGIWYGIVAEQAVGHNCDSLTSIGSCSVQYIIKNTDKAGTWETGLADSNGIFATTKTFTVSAIQAPLIGQIGSPMTVTINTPSNDIVSLFVGKPVPNQVIADSGKSITFTPTDSGTVTIITFIFGNQFNVFSQKVPVS